MKLIWKHQIVFILLIINHPIVSSINYLVRKIRKKAFLLNPIIILLLFYLWKPANILLKQSKGNYRTASSFKNRRSWRFIFCWSTDGAAQQLSELVTRLLNRLCLKKKNWEPYGSRRGEDEDDVSSLAAVDSPVLRPLQAGDAHVASLQAPHVGAGLIERKKNHLFLNHRRINDWSCGVLYWQVKPKPKKYFSNDLLWDLHRNSCRTARLCRDVGELTEYKARTAGNECRWRWRSRPGWSLTGGELREPEKL